MAGSSPWSVKGIASQERELAKQAARRAGGCIGAGGPVRHGIGAVSTAGLNCPAWITRSACRH